MRFNYVISKVSGDNRILFLVVRAGVASIKILKSFWKQREMSWPNHPFVNPLSIFFVNSPFHIRFRRRPYFGSFLKRWSFSRMIMAFKQFSQCRLLSRENSRSLGDAREGSSCLKSPANMMEYPPNALFLLRHSFSHRSSLSISESCMNEISSMTKIQTSFHLSISSWFNAAFFLRRKAALQIVTPPKNDAADPV